MATRADVIGPELAHGPAPPAGPLPPFSQAEARRAVEEALGGKLEDHFVSFGPPVAAASIAQVHKAVVIDNGVRRTVAVKVLRPGVEKRFKRDLDSYFFAARQIERFHAALAPPEAASPSSTPWRARPSSRWTCGSKPPPSPRWPTTSRANGPARSPACACPPSTGGAPPSAC